MAVSIHQLFKLELVRSVEGDERGWSSKVTIQIGSDTKKISLNQRQTHKIVNAMSQDLTHIIDEILESE